MGGHASGWRRTAALSVIGLLGITALLAPRLAPHLPHEQFAAYPYAPPMRLRIVTADGSLRAPFVYRLRLVNRLERLYAEDETQPIPVAWLTGGRLLSLPDGQQPLLLLGSDALGRDVWARLVFGARLSLGIAVTATLGSLLIGIVVGAFAAAAGGWIDDALMRTADFVLALPIIYVLLVLRGALPLVMETGQVFLALTSGLILVGWPQIARGVRAVLAAEASKPYVEAAVAAGASPLRVFRVHTLPATRSFVAGQAALLVPATVLAEAALSYAGFGFAEPAASWGTMLHDAGSVSVFAGFPWLLAPAAAIGGLSIAVRADVKQGGATTRSAPAVLRGFRAPTIPG